MSNQGASSFSSINAHRTARFISYREAIQKLAEHDNGADLGLVAETLKAFQIHSRGEAWLTGPEKTIMSGGKGHMLAKLLDMTMATGAIGDVITGFDEPDAHPDTSGWVREKLLEALIEAQLPCPASLSKPLPYVPPSALTRMKPWARPYLSRHEITLWEATWLLLGLDPNDRPEFLEELGSDLNSWRKSLIDAIDNHDIDASTWSTDRDEQRLSHYDLRVWCASFGHPWPIPEIAPDAKTALEEIAPLDGFAGSTPKTDEKLLKRCAEEQEKRALAEKRLAEVEQKLLEMGGQIQETDDDDDDLKKVRSSTYLNIIGALCDLYWTAAYPKEQRLIQARIIDLIDERYNGYPGTSARQLKKILPRALRAIRPE